MTSIEIALAVTLAAALLFVCILGVKLRNLGRILPRDVLAIRDRLADLETQVREVIAARAFAEQLGRQVRIVVHETGLDPAEIERRAALLERIKKEVAAIARSRHDADVCGMPSEKEFLDAARALGRIVPPETDRRIVDLLKDAVITSFRPRVSHFEMRKVTRIGERIAGGQSYDRNTEEFEYEDEEREEVIDSPSDVVVQIDIARLEAARQ